MIQKIQNGEYLKRVDNMTADESEEYRKRVGEWLRDPETACLAACAEDPSAAFQNVLQVSVGWNDMVCRAWTEGVRLLTALVATEETWLPDMLYTKSAKRVIRQMVSVVSSFKIQVSGDRDGIAGQQTKQVAKEEPADKARKGTQAVALFRNSDQGNHDGEGKPSDVKATPVRPKHIDQYVHLMPKRTQERAAMVCGLLRDLDVARENARRLMDADGHPDKIAQWAKTATLLDSKVRAIYDELDSEWEKLVSHGRVAVDDFGNAYVTEEGKGEKEEPAAAQQDTQQEGRPAGRGQAKAAKQAEEDAKRREYLKKWLRDTRTAVSDERRELWEKNCKELLALGGELTDSIRKAAGHYGVELERLKD